MKIKAVFLAFLAFALGVQARVVTESEALCAAVALDGASGGSVMAAKTPGGLLYYAVSRPGGGYAILSGETRVEPLLAFSPSDEVVLDAKSPLAALVAADLSARWPSATRLTAAGTSAAKPTAAEEKWAALLAKGERLAATPENPVKKESYLDDPRVSPLVETRWDQGQVLAKEGDRIVKTNCYNVYTPEYTYVDHTTGKTCTKRCVCGCIATAMAQILRYWKQPSGVQPSFSGTCTMPDKVTWSETLGRYTSTTKTVTLTSQPGPYVWSWMVEVPGPDTLYPGSLDEIGKLTYACGISVGMEYDIEDEGGSGILTSEVSRIPKAIRERFGYVNAALTGWSAGKNNAILASLDAECPVLLCVRGPTEGHAVVADGYGFKDDTRYVHLNMGWSGQQDLWYNLPEIPLDDNPESFDKFDEVVSIIYNVNPHKAREYVTGRVLDEDGKPVYDACVTLRVVGDPYSSDVVYSNERGIYCLEAESGKAYTIVATTDKYCSDVVTTPVLANSQAGSAVGNIWGNELVLHNPSVQLNGGSALFSTLDAALAVATDDDEIEIIAPTELRADAVVNCPCRIVSMDPSVATVTRVGGARLTVASGARLELSDVKFTGASSTLVGVEAGGCLAVGSGVFFGVSEKVAAVVTQAADGFELALGPEDEAIGVLAEPFALDCVAAGGLDQVFGFATCHPDVAAAQAGRILNINDPNGEIAGQADGDAPPVALKWAVVPVPLGDAAAYYVIDGQPETTNCFRRLDRLFEFFEKVEEPAEITVVKNGTLSRKVTLTNDLRVVSSTGAIVSNLASTAGFVIGEGKTLKVDGVSFDGYKGDALFLVEGGRLELGGDMAIRNVDGANARYSGAVAVLSGSAVIGSAAGTVVFENCRNIHQNAYGGAVYLDGTDCSLTLQHTVSITGCRAGAFGGGVHMVSGAVVSLSGFLTVADNVSSAGADDLCYMRSKTDVGTLRLAGLVETGSRVGIRVKGSAAAKLNVAGASFLTVDEAFTDLHDIQKSSEAFFCDADSKLQAKPNDDPERYFKTLCWYVDEGGVKPVDPAAATARVVFEDGSEGWYGSVEDAFAVALGNSTIELLADAEIVSNITVSGSVTLRSGVGGPYAATRAAPCRFCIGEGASLTVENVTVDGRLDEARGGDGLLFEVLAGELTLGEGAVLQDVSGGTAGYDGAVKVVRGTVTMLPGSAIRNCVNEYGRPGVLDSSCGGGIAADSLSTVRLRGGVIEGCAAYRGGGVFVGNTTTVEIEGDFTATDDVSVSGGLDNVYVADTSGLILTGKLIGRVGYSQGNSADPYVFGRVADGFSGSDADIANSAHNFRNDANGDIGFAVRNGSETLLVWSDGLDGDGNFVRDDRTYVSVAGGDVLLVPVPVAVGGLVYTAAEQVGVEAGHGFLAAGDRATAAGDYTATLKLKAGFAWEGSAEDPAFVDWSIAPATLTVTAVACGKVQGEADPALTYTVAGLQGADRADEVLSGALVRVEGEDPGTYAILQGTLAAVDTNYTLTYIGADFTITEPTPPPEPPKPTPVPCKPFAFTAILNPAEGSWQLTISPAVRYCTYTVLASDDLVTWSPVIVDEEATADGDMTFTQPATGPQKFWKAVGKDGEKPADE